MFKDVWAKATNLHLHSRRRYRASKITCPSYPTLPGSVILMRLEPHPRIPQCAMQCNIANIANIATNKHSYKCLSWKLRTNTVRSCCLHHMHISRIVFDSNGHILRTVLDSHEHGTERVLPVNYSWRACGTVIKKCQCSPERLYVELFSTAAVGRATNKAHRGRILPVKNSWMPM